MWIIINKKPNSNQWHYPDTPALFVDAFHNGAELVARYTGTKTAAEMSATEYTGELPKGPNAIRIISVGSFQRRFPANVRKQIRESTIDAVIDLREDLALAMYVDLDDEYTVSGINALGPSGLAWLTAEEIVTMLADGTEREKYNGPL